MANWDNFANADDEAFDAETDADGDLNAAAAAVHSGTNGYAVTFDDANVAYGTLNAAAIDQTAGTIEMWLDPNGVGLTSGKSIVVGNPVSGVPTTSWQILLRNTSGTYSIRATARNDAGTDELVAAGDIADAYHRVRLVFRRATGAGNNDGIAHLFVDGVLIGSKTNSDNDTKDWDTCRFGMIVTDQAADFSGSFYMDDIQIANTLVYEQAIAGTLTTAGTIAKKGKKALAGTLTTAGDLDRVFHKFKKLLARFRDYVLRAEEHPTGLTARHRDYMLTAPKRGIDE